MLARRLGVHLLQCAQTVSFALQLSLAPLYSCCVGDSQPASPAAAPCATTVLVLQSISLPCYLVIPLRSLLPDTLTLNAQVQAAEQRKARLDRVTQQLRDLYGPLLAVSDTFV
jgi:hypothetical protein